MKLSIFILCTLLYCFSYCQTNNELEQYYYGSYMELKNMLEGKDTLSFKKAVFIAENVYFNNELDYEKFNAQITKKINIARLWMKSNVLVDYSYSDSNEFKANAAIFNIMTDTFFLSNTIPISYPYRYDFNDFFGREEWAHMFVSKLLVTGKGNCHSLPYLYKILAEELGAKAYLSFAPNHLYIKQRSKKFGWYNTELTSATFPIDSWIMTSGYISREAILSGIYMDTLSDKQSITLCLVDLAHSCRRKAEKDNTNTFIIECCNLALKYFPHYVNAHLLKLETLKREYQKDQSEEQKKQFLMEIQKTVRTLITLGYREIPPNVYMQWLNELRKNKENYHNKKLTNSIKN